MATTTPRVRRKTLVNRVTLILDVSESMSRVTVDAERMLNSLVTDFKRVPRGQKTTLSLYTFGERVLQVFSQKPVELVEYIHFNPWESATCLRDAIGTAIDEQQAAKGATDEHVAHLFVTITDGQDNVNRLYSADEVGRDITRLQATNKWTFAFHCPPRGKELVVNLFHVPPDNVREWEATSRGVELMTQANTSSSSGFYGTRSAGFTSTPNYFNPDPDMLYHHKPSPPKAIRKSRKADVQNNS